MAVIWQHYSLIENNNNEVIGIGSQLTSGAMRVISSYRRAARIFHFRSRGEQSVYKYGWDSNKYCASTLYERILKVKVAPVGNNTH